MLLLLKITCIGPLGFIGYNSLQWPLGCNLSSGWGCILTTLLPVVLKGIRQRKLLFATFAELVQSMKTGVDKGMAVAISC